MAERPTVDASGMHTCATTGFDNFGFSCCGERDLHLVRDSESFVLTQRAGRIGSVTLAKVVGSDMSMDCGQRWYLHEVRLRGVHQSLLESDPSTVTVASVACHGGFANLGRFAAAHNARYGEPPLKTLRRRTFSAGRRSRCG